MILRRWAANEKDMVCANHFFLHQHSALTSASSVFPGLTASAPSIGIALLLPCSHHSVLCTPLRRSDLSFLRTKINFWRRRTVFDRKSRNERKQSSFSFPHLSPLPPFFSLSSSLSLSPLAPWVGESSGVIHTPPKGNFPELVDPKPETSQRFRACIRIFRIHICIFRSREGKEVCSTVFTTALICLEV